MNRLFVISGLALLGACGGSSADPCKDVSGTCVPIHAGADHEEVQTAFIDVQPNTTIAFEAGVYDMDSELDLDVDHVTIQGAGMDDTVLSFANEATGAQGLYVTAGDFTLQDIGLEDAPADILKIEGVDNVNIFRVRSEYTGGASSDHGGYAVYPVQCGNVHIKDSKAFGSSDTGLYVGQSHDVIVENNYVERNVSGIEIENTTNADVHDNEATGNTGGVLVFNLPTLQVYGQTTRVYDNNIHDNNEPNFAPNGIVGKVPTGTGIALLAAKNVEVFGNTISNHKSINLGIIDYSTTMETYDDPNYDPASYSIEIHDNTFVGGGDQPTGQLGALLILVMAEVNHPIVPDMVWDGVVAPAYQDQTNPLELDADHQICIHDNGDADFSNLHWPDGTAPVADFDLTPHDCDHPDLPAVTLP
jgi:parallel beta-helix repeat protein